MHMEETNASDIILMQEISTTEGDRKGIEHDAREHGYRVYFATGQGKRTGAEKATGGVATLVCEDCWNFSRVATVDGKRLVSLGEKWGFAVWGGPFSL